MSAEEIVCALRTCNKPKGHRCSECPVFSRYEHRICKATVDRQAAALIESQAAEIKRLNQCLGRHGWDDVSERKLKNLKHKLECKTKECGKFQAQLTASQQETRAAVERLKRKCMDELAAVKCICDIETYLELGSAKYIKKTIDSWRGPQEAGEEKA